MTTAKPPSSRSDDVLDATSAGEAPPEEVIVSSNVRPRAIARAEPVGSLLRPRDLIAQLKRAFEHSRTGARPLVIERWSDRLAELDRCADAHVLRLIRHQIDAGLDVVTDGELRRSIFLSSFYDSLGGLEEPKARPEAGAEGGSDVGYAEPVFAERLHKRYAPAAIEAAFMQVATDHPFKITLPSPSQFLSDFVDLNGSPYTTHAAFLEDAVLVLRQIAAEAVTAGAQWIQFDFPIYPALVADSHSPMGSMIDAAGSEGETTASLLERALAADRAVIEGLPETVTLALHICRGNFPGGFWSGSLTPIAEQIFDLPYDRFLIEWEDVAREGGYEAIQAVPSNRTVVMGLVSTKTPELEDEDELLRRIEAAAKYLDVSQLAISPQCGFASVFGDHLADVEAAQWRKLELVGRVADRVWSRDRATNSK